MQLPYVRWIAAAGGVVALIALVLYKRRRRLTVDDVGSVSAQWVAQHRATVPDE